MSAAASPSDDAAQFAILRWHAGLLVGLGLLAFWNGIYGQFVLDDTISLIDDKQMYHVWPWGPIHDVNRWFGVWTLQWSYAIGGLDPRPYHLVNIAIHLAAGLTLWDLARRCLRLPGTARWLRSAADSLALAIAALWLVHPLQTQSVTYIVQRYESLMALCFLLTLYCTLRGATATHQWRWYSAAAICAWLSAGTKEVAVACPLVLLLFDRCFLAASWREAFRRRWLLHAAVGLAAIWLLFAVRGTFVAGGSTANAGFGYRGVSAWEYLRSQPAVILHYLRLAFWPDVLVLDPGWPVEHSPWRIYGLGAVILAMLAGGAVALWRWPRLGFLGLSFFFILAPTSSILPIADLAFEHRMYLPLAPIVVLTVLAGWSLLACSPLSAQRRPWAGGGLLCVALVALTLRTISRNDDYAHPDRLWANNIRHAPHHARPYRLLAFYHRKRGAVDEAQAWLRAALDREPNDPKSWIDLGSLCSESKDYDAALAHFRRGLQIDPHAALGHANIGRVLMIRGEYAGAIEATRQALDMERRNSIFIRQLAWLLATVPADELRNGRESLELINRTRQDPRRTDIQWLGVRAAALAEVGRFDEAVIDASRAVAGAEALRSHRLNELRQQLASYRAGRPWRLHRLAPGPRSEVARKP